MRGDEILLLGIEIQPPSQKLLPVMCLKLVIAGLPQAWPIATSILFKKRECAQSRRSTIMLRRRQDNRMRWRSCPQSFRPVSSPVQLMHRRRG